MLSLENAHPSVSEAFTAGDLVVQRSRNAFSQLSVDQTIEQTDRLLVTLSPFHVPITVIVTVGIFQKSLFNKTITVTVNRDTKSRGGIVGFSLNKGAVQRWLHTSHERAAITEACCEIVGYLLQMVMV